MEQVQIPSDVASVIDQKRAAMHAKYEAEEKAKKEKEDARIQRGRERVQAAIQAALAEVPEWLRPYDATITTYSEGDLESAGRDDIYHGREPWLLFRVPGLAAIQRCKEEVRGTDKFHVQWRAAAYCEDYRDYGPDLPKLDFTNYSYWREDLEYTLVEAADNWEHFAQKKAQYEEAYTERSRNNLESAEREQEREARDILEQEARQAQKQAEEQALLDNLKGDPVALAMLKAYVLLRQERASFEYRLQEADSTLYSMEENYSRRAAELRRQAEYAEQRAAEEKRRLEDDLDDAERKVKKLERGW